MRPGSETSRISDSAVTLLPQPDFADDGQRLAALQREGDAVDRLDEARARVEAGLQVLDLEHGLGRLRSIRSRAACG